MAREQKENTLGEWSDGDDDWILDIVENTLGEWSDPDDDEIVRNINENVQTGRGSKRKSVEDEEKTSTSRDFYEIESVKKEIQKNSERLLRITQYVLITPWTI